MFSHCNQFRSSTQLPKVQQERPEFERVRVESRPAWPPPTDQTLQEPEPAQSGPVGDQQSAHRGGWRERLHGAGFSQLLHLRIRKTQIQSIRVSGELVRSFE
jgi:hypothetical protein